MPAQSKDPCKSVVNISHFEFHFKVEGSRSELWLVAHLSVLAFYKKN